VHPYGRADVGDVVGHHVLVLAKVLAATSRPGTSRPGNRYVDPPITC
jgi:hypothetical protein